MDLSFTINEIIIMAQRIEQKSWEFYTEISNIYPEHQEIFKMLAEEEAGHGEKLNEIDKNSCKDTVEGELSIRYLNALSDELTDKMKGLISLTDGTTFGSIIDMAVSWERHTIEYFIGIKSLLTSETSIELVEKLISEEVDHIGKLIKYYEQHESGKKLG